MKNDNFEDSPKSLGLPEAREARKALLRDIHIAPLTAFVDNLRVRMGSKYQIPYFDPCDGGTAAEVLFLLEAPGPQAMRSGFISRNNPDPTANNAFYFNQKAGLSRKRTISWNVVPWYIGAGSRIRSATSKDIDLGVQSLNSLLGLLTKLRAIVLFGKKAQSRAIQIAKLRPDIKIFDSPHPSPQFVNRAKGNGNKIVVALRKVANYLDTSGSP